MVVVCFNQGEVKDNMIRVRMIPRKNIRDVLAFLKYENIIITRAINYFLLKHFSLHGISLFTQT